jgi:hypothetical protein
MFRALLLTLSFLTALPAADTSAGFVNRFADPPAEFRSAPFFVWNGEVTETEIDRFLEDYKAKGAGGVFLHPRPGLITPYLSERWFALVSHAVQKGKSLGMKIWLYDENSYPSGFAGGHVPAEMPESWNQGQGLVLKKVSQVDPAEAANYKVILRRTASGFEPVPPPAQGDLYVFEVTTFPKRAWNGGFAYVDLIKPGVTDKFLELTMKGYERAIGAEFGKTVPGIFTDEPGIQPPVSRMGFKWTPDLFGQFQTRRGYDLVPLLVSLVEETGDWKKVRHDYQLTLLELFIERWAKPYSNYAASKGLAWTGHYWEHEWPNLQHGPDSMAMYAWHQVPGIDMLFNQFAEGPNAQFGNVRSVKELVSVANQLGRRRTLSETYGGGGWELRYIDMKRLGDWQAVLGVNLMNQHLSFLTMEGARKQDYPQSFSYHNPWWKHYRLLGDYFGRVSMAMATGEQINTTLVLEPTTTMWMYQTGGAVNPHRMELANAFQAFVTRLAYLQADYDLGSEAILKDHGQAGSAKLRVGQRSYTLVVLPPGTENLESSTVRLLETYLKNGGAVLSFVGAPAFVDGASSAEVARLKREYTARWGEASSLDDAATRARLVSPEFAEVSGALFHHKRQLADGELYFLTNSSLDAEASATLRLKRKFITRLGLVTGTKQALAGTRVTLPPAGSMLLLATDTAPAGTLPSPPAPRAERVVAPKGALEVRRLALNVLTIDYCDLKIGGAENIDIYYLKAADTVFRHYGFDGNPWSTAVQYKTSILDRNHFPRDSGFDATYHLTIGAGLNRASLRAVVERPELWRVSVNGTELTPRPGDWWLDRAFGVFDIASSVKEGENVLTLHAQPMSVHAEIEPIYVLGDFALQSVARGWTLVPQRPLQLGSWEAQGLPFYPQEVGYAQEFDLARGAHHVVRLNRWQGTVAEVLVNGKSAGAVGWPPYELDITRLVKAGPNRVEVRVTGSLKNQQGPHHGKPNPGLVGPGSFRAAPEHMPAGADYQFLAYGLDEPFSVMERR